MLIILGVYKFIFGSVKYDGMIFLKIMVIIHYNMLTNIE